MNMWRICIQFLIIFAIIYLLYYFFTIRKIKKNPKYIPVEVNLILMKYKINLNKEKLYKMTNVVCFFTSLILSFSVTIISEIRISNILSLIFGSLLAVVIAMIIYGFIGKYYKKNEK